MKQNYEPYNYKQTTASTATNMIFCTHQTIDHWFVSQVKECEIFQDDGEEWDLKMGKRNSNEWAEFEDEVAANRVLHLSPTGKVGLFLEIWGTEIGQG